VYYQALADLSRPLLEAAIVAASRGDREFIPRPGELRAFAEQARRAQLAARPWRPCPDCAPLAGFIETIDTHGVARLMSCPCRDAYWRRLADDGIPSRSVLEGPSDEREDAAMWASVPAPPEPDHVAAAAMPILADMRAIARVKTMPSTLPPQTDPDGHPLPEWPRRRRGLSLVRRT
jgi:hypothetical protein